MVAHASSVIIFIRDEGCSIHVSFSSPVAIYCSAVSYNVIVISYGNL